MNMENKCPYCGGEIDIDEIDLNDSVEDGYGDLLVYQDCPNCGMEVTAHFEDGGDYEFKYID